MAFFKELYDAYLKGLNINKYLQKNNNLPQNSKISSLDAIALSYDLQAGSYTRSFYKDYDRSKRFIDYIINNIEDLNLINILKKESNELTICDFGTGEATNYSLLINSLQNKGFDLIPFGMDISLSRLSIAMHLLSIECQNKNSSFFLGDLTSIPIADNSLDISLTMHSIEPNQGKEEIILNELIRVTRNFIVLAEPIYETATKEQAKRMREFNYIKSLRTKLYENNLVEVIHDSFFPIEIIANPNNRTTLLIARKKQTHYSHNKNSKKIYSCPIEKINLTKTNNFWISKLGTCYPEINSIPILLSSKALPYYHAIKYSEDI